MFRLSMAKIEAAAMADCEVEALREYIGEHGRGNGGEEGLYPQLTSIITEKVKQPGGNILVTVSVINRRAWLSDTFVFSLQVAGRKVRRRKVKPGSKV